MMAEMERDFPAAQWTKTAPRRPRGASGGGTLDVEVDADTSDDVDDDAKLLLSLSRAMFSTAFCMLATSELDGAFRRGLMLRSPSSMNLTAWGSSMRRSESSTSSMSMRRC